MEINNTGPTPRIQIQPQPPSNSAGNVDGGQTVNRTDDVQPARLLQRLEGDASVREQQLADVSERFQAGEYSTRSAAEEAAQNIVDS